jgi:AcrR family transcriptional regulator
MKSERIDIGTIRREQVIDAAVAIIAGQGIQNLSLSEIEKKAGMSRGQLTYYFPAKEDILVAAFDRLLRMMKDRAEAGEGGSCAFAELPHGWERIAGFLTWFLLNPPAVPEFHALQYTFLSQISHRDDFRERLANLYEEWRRQMAEDFAADLGRKDGGRASPRTLATLVQAVLHGLAIERAAAPDAYDKEEMLELVLDLLGSYLKRRSPDRPSLSKVTHAERQ